MVNRERAEMLERLKEKPKQRRSWVSKAPLKFQNILPYNGGALQMGGALQWGCPVGVPYNGGYPTMGVPYNGVPYSGGALQWGALQWGVPYRGVPSYLGVPYNGGGCLQWER